MKKKSIKKWILGLFSAMMLSLVVGFSLPKTEAKAAVVVGNFPITNYDIDDYEWANYLDISETHVYPSLFSSHNFTDIFEPYNCRWGDPLSNMVFRVKDLSYFNGKSSFLFGLELSIFDDFVPNLELGEKYVFNFNMYCSGSPQISLGSSTCLYIGDFIEDGIDAYDNTLYDFHFGYRMDLNSSTPYLGYLNSDGLNSFNLIIHLTNVAFIKVGDLFTFSNLSLNKGDVTYSYSDYFYDLKMGFPRPLPSRLGFDNQSYQSGFSDGFSDGVAQSQYGFLGSAHYWLHLESTDNMVYDYEVEPAKIFGGRDFTNVYNSYVSNFPGTLSSAKLRIYFTPFVPPSALALYGEGSSYFFNSNMFVYAEVNGGSNPVLHWDVSSSESSLYETTLVRGESLGNWRATSIETSNFTSLDFLNGLRLFVTDSYLYENGYLVGSGEGYDKGYYEGLEANQQEIYDKAYDEGHRIGYDDGFVVGSRANNSFLGLFTAAIDAPVLTFTSMLDFDVLGFNMKSIVLSLLSIALVVAIIRLFSKGGSSG